MAMIVAAMIMQSLPLCQELLSFFNKQEFITERLVLSGYLMVELRNWHWMAAGMHGFNSL